jgi:hypothetical protein
MGVVKAQDIQALLPGPTLDGYQLPGIDIVPILWRIGASIAGTRHGGHQSVIVFHTPQEHPATLVRVGFLAVAAELIVATLVYLQHKDSFTTETRRIIEG